MVPSLDSTLTTVLETAGRLKDSGAAGNEANTRALLIDPVLAALGWNLLDFEEVEREFRVFDGTLLDYALRVDGRPRLFVEAKALSRRLADKQFIAQTVNYANNEGVIWCVLTNGLTYQVYKSNEPVAMERKLLFEVDVTEASDPERRRDVIQSLRKLGKEAVTGGELDAWGEQVFVDVRTREALVKLGREPSTRFLRAVGNAIEGPEVEPARLRASLARILGQESGASSAEPVVGRPPAPPKPKAPVESAKPPRKTYDVQHHAAGKPSSIVSLFETVDSYGTGLGPDVERRVAKYYIGYFAGKRSFFTIELQKAKINVCFSIPAAEARPWVEDAMRDISTVGHQGLGDTQFVLRSEDQLPALEALIRDAYLRNRK
jgi:predicted transport protein